LGGTGGRVIRLEELIDVSETAAIGMIELKRSIGLVQFECGR